MTDNIFKSFSKSSYSEKKRLFLILLLSVSAVVFIVHLPVLSSKALSFDDQGYFTENMLVQNPSFASAIRFLTEVFKPSTIPGYYQPVTMISIMMDYALGGRINNLWQFRLTSLALHLFNTCLIAILIYLLFEQPFIAAIAALVFGLHPMTVEPICWIGERKTLLAMFFTLFSLISYLGYIKRKDKLSYSASIVFFLLALLSKPTATPLPLLLLLLDYWPLRRLTWKAFSEKIPFFIIAAISGVITYISQSRSASVALPTQYGIERIPLFICHNIIFYLAKIFWPVNLTSHYAIPKQPWLAQPMIIAGLIGTCLLILILIVSLRWSRAPLVGWLFFFIALMPTMQVVQFSDVIASDKFVYLPSIGLLLILAAFLRWLWSSTYFKPLLISLVVISVASMEAFATRSYLRHWRDSVSLFEHMATLTPDAAPVRGMLGVAYIEQGRVDEAVKNFNLALEKDPNRIEVLLNLAKLYAQRNDTKQAFNYYQKVLDIQPANFKAIDAIGLALMDAGKFDDAIEFYRIGIKYNPNKSLLHANLGVALAKKGQIDEAITEFRTAEKLYPSSEIHSKLGALLFSTGQIDEPIQHYRAAIRLDPGNIEAYYYMGNALLQKGEPAKAAPYYRKAINLNPNYSEAYANLAVAMAMQGKLEEAINYLMRALSMQPRNVQIRLILAQALSENNKFKEAAREYSKVLEIDPNNPAAKEGLKTLAAQNKTNQ
jgi:tetratricopeptide (TPR) repeat protein